MFAILGEIFFETLTSPKAFHSAAAYSYAEHKVVEARPRLQWMANELQKISLDLQFHVAFTNPATQMNLLRAAAEDHQARALIFGNGVHRGYFVIEALEETFQQLADDGSYIAISARVELREWVPGADFDPLAPPRWTTLPPGIVLGTIAATVVFDAAQAIGAGNLAPVSDIVTLAGSAVYGGVTYSAAPYSQRGVSGIAGAGPAAAAPGNPANIAPSAIVRAA
jgi:phage protein U